MRTRLRSICRFVAAGWTAALLLAIPLSAEHTRYWRQSNYDEFEKGTAKGVGLRSDGKLVLAPRMATFADPNSAYLWSLRLDSKGNLYAAGGSNAKVLRFDPMGKATTVFESAEMAAQALALDAQDNLYVGTSPDGKVYRITPAGVKSVFFEPKTKYIWSLLVDADGTLYVATGDKGEIFAVSADGKGQLFYASEESHIRALALDGKGNLLVGTEPNGLVLRIPKEASATREKKTTRDAGNRPAFVLYETAKKEITALVVDASGYIYAAAVGEKQRPSPVSPQFSAGPPQLGGPSAAQPTLTLGTTGAISQQPTVFVPFPPMISSAVYRLAADGAPEELWNSRDELVYALGFSPAGKLLLGTGNRGMVIEMEGGNVFTTLARTTSSQVTGIAQDSSGKVYLCSANPGKVFTLGPEGEPEGSFESQTFDARIFSQWGRLEWWDDGGTSQDAPKNGAGTVAFYVRSGNTSNPEKNWSPWAGPYGGGKAHRVDCPPARFAQWKAVFSKPSGAARPEASQGNKEKPAGALNVSWVSLAYLPKNVAPIVEAVLLQIPGVRAQSLAGPPPGGASPQPVPLRMPTSSPTGVFIVASQMEKQSQRFEAPPQGFAQKGYQSVVWSARDDNDDDMVYTIYYRGEGEKNWRLLKDKIDQKFYSWDTTTLPDGAYYLKVVASDAPSNPAEDALVTERESDRFVVDNTPPIVENLRAETTSRDAHVRFDARDTTSAIARADYSLDGGDWKLAFPVGRLSDALQESYELMLRGLTPGEHTLAVRVFDQFDNTSSAKITFHIAPGKK